MPNAMLEHVNITVPNPKQTAAMLCDLFGWSIRWEGAAMAGGYTVHVGTRDDYIALYRPADPSSLTPFHTERAGKQVGGLNHIAVTVEDIDAADKAIRAAGFETENHADYAPGRRFYFYDLDGIEYEVVSYTSAKAPA